ncbi:growth arrest-specific protein 1-like [Actinia tenebrosa]|uniref:Growth arrest-specific protein 1-like n=1 Tax=Actinia tenebrosa TaxID=6105 RepID=A0A6P8HPP0_ACTTE|nr:growth arrest-specific protein 1-like [Actinia tenebrosa]
MPSVDTKLLGLATYLILMSSGSLSEDGDTLVNRTIDCMRARKQCIKDFTNCGIYLYRVFGGKKPCSKHLGYDFQTEQITGPADKVCPTFCSQAIYNLTSRPEGRLLQSCECVNRDSICLTVKARMAKCVDMAVNGPRNDSKPGCTEIRKLCSKDEQCNGAQQYFLRKCSRLISGLECSKDCKRAQKLLLSLPLGNGLNECECDGYEEPHCRGIRAHQQALCFGTRVTKSVTPKNRPTQNVQRVNSGNSESRENLSRLSIYTALAIVFLGVSRWELC